MYTFLIVLFVFVCGSTATWKILQSHDDHSDAMIDGIIGFAISLAGNGFLTYLSFKNRNLVQIPSAEDVRPWYVFGSLVILVIALWFAGKPTKKSV